MKRALLLALTLVCACQNDLDLNLPVKPAPPSRHDALRDGLLADSANTDARTGPAIAYLAHGPNPRPPETIETVEVGLGAVEYAATTGDRSVVPGINALIARVDEPDYANDTVATARVALLEVEATRLLGEDRRARAIAHDDAIRARAFGDFADPVTNRQVRAYAATPDTPVIDGAANVAMLILKARLFRLTQDETYRLEGRAIYAALATYNPASAGDHAELAFATSLLFEITGDDRYINRADQAFDAIVDLRGAEFKPEQCPGCAFHSLWALGYRRGLAGEAY